MSPRLALHIACRVNCIFQGSSQDPIVLFASVATSQSLGRRQPRSAKANQGLGCILEKVLSIPTRPMDETDSFPVRMGGGIKFLKEQFGQLADVLRSEQLDARNR